MELSTLRSVVTLAETANYSRAAERLFITQPALSQQISGLEAELGLKLFERTTRRVTLTRAGEEFVRRARQILEEADQLSQSMDLCRREMLGSLSVGLLSTLSHLNIPEYISGFQALYPNIRIKFQIAWSSALIDQVLHRELDAAITNIHIENNKADPRLNVRVFSEDVITVLCSRKRKIARRDFVTMEDLADEPVIANEKSTSIRMSMESIFAASGVHPPVIVCTCPDMESLIGMVRANIGICYLSSGVAHQYIAGGELVAVPLHPTYYTHTAMITLADRRDDSLSLQYFEDYFYGIIH